MSTKTVWNFDVADRVFFKIEDKNIHYKGIVDAEGKAFGHGTATEMHNERGSIWKGTFLNN